MVKEPISKQARKKIIRAVEEYVIPEYSTPSAD